MKHSPLCSRDEGREVYFTAKDGDTKLRFIVGRGLLDDTCGDTANEHKRKTWVKDHLDDILAIRLQDNAIAAPFDRVLVEEIN